MVADALSRKDEDIEVLFFSPSIRQPDWLVEAREKWMNDLSMWIPIQKLQKDLSVLDNFSW